MEGFTPIAEGHAEVGIPGSALFACDWNAVRSPMAEGISKHLLGTQVFLQSAGALGEMPLDPFAVAVCAEIGVDIARHRTHTLDEMAQWGDDLGQYDLIVALSPAARARALKTAAVSHVAVEFWPIPDPTETGESRNQKLDAYRAARDLIIQRIRERFAAIL
jgi:arsenate reductase